MFDEFIDMSFVSSKTGLLHIFAYCLDLAASFDFLSSVSEIDVASDLKGFISTLSSRKENNFFVRIDLGCCIIDKVLIFQREDYKINLLIQLFVWERVLILALGFIGDKQSCL